jgi:glucose-1-phosphate thymidylyltransferase
MGLRVVIPVAGVGTRLRPHTHTLPKVLVPVAGRPMLGHILEELRAYDVDEVTLVVGYLGDLVREYVTGAFPYKFRFVEQSEMKGLGHAIWLTKPEGAATAGPLLIVLGDTLFDADFKSILNSKSNWIGVKEVEDGRRFGIVELEGDRIVRMVEKPKVPPTNLAIVGIYLIQDPELLYGCLDRIVGGDVRSAGEIQLTDALVMMLNEGAEMRPFKIDAWYDCGKPETLLDTNRRILDRDATKGRLGSTGHRPDVVIRQPVAIAADALIEASIIGPHVTVQQGATIRGSIIEDSIVSAQAEIVGAHLSGSIIGERAVIQGRPTMLNVGDSSTAG